MYDSCLSDITFKSLPILPRITLVHSTWMLTLLKGMNWKTKAEKYYSKYILYLILYIKCKSVQANILKLLILEHKPRYCFLINKTSLENSPRKAENLTCELCISPGRIQVCKKKKKMLSLLHSLQSSLFMLKSCQGLSWAKSLSSYDMWYRNKMEIHWE